MNRRKNNSFKIQKFKTACEIVIDVGGFFFLKWQLV